MAHPDSRRMRRQCSHAIVSSISRVQNHPREHEPVQGFCVLPFIASALLLLHSFALDDTPSAFIPAVLRVSLSLDSDSAFTPSLGRRVGPRPKTSENASALSFGGLSWAFSLESIVDEKKRPKAKWCVLGVCVSFWCYTVLFGTRN